MKNDRGATLDELQRAILWNLAQGMTGSQVARINAVSEATMRRALRKARQLLGAVNTINAIYLAAKRGLI
ncbi:MAG: hypothetical protein M3280_00065 [Actinomycetota bacterium]|nr:hypothetical protein [Actinomycetota bacterium]